MGCPSFVIIGNTLTFSITTHDPDTGVLTDAAAVPDYWIYEDETGVSINANTPNADVMAKVDDAHTTGFYSETITCSVANGYEDGKTYTVYIEATVDGDRGGMAYSFTAYTRLPVDIEAISTSTAAADNLEASARTIIKGTVSHDATAATTTIFYSDDVTEATADHYNGRVIIFTPNGVDETLLGQATEITDYALVAGEGQFTVTALTEAPADNCTFVII